MPQLDISQTTSSDMTNSVADFSVTALNLDSPGEQAETEWQSTNWTKYWGYFNSVPDLKSAILMKAIWNVGKGYETNDIHTKVILDQIYGWGKDTFDDILFNMEIIKRVNGDAYAEIIRDPKTKSLINLKPLDPGSMKIIVNKQGQIIRYEQTERVSKGKGKVFATFKPEQIFHLSNNRLADQIHGISDIESLEPTLLAEEENFADMKKIVHRQAKPLIMFKLKTDKQSKIDAFIAKMDTAINKGEHVYIPDDENSVTYEVVQVNVSQVVMEWRTDIRNKFYRTIGLPQVIPGAGGGGTESSEKIVYFAFEQIVEKDQRYLEKQIWAQLGLKINLIPPASLSGDLQQDTAKDGQMQVAQPNDTMAGVGQ